MASKNRDPSYLIKKKRFIRSAQDYVDIDYYDTLSDADKEWISNFYAMQYDNDTTSKEFLNVSDDMMREIYKQANSRNADLYTRVKHRGELVNFEPLLFSDDKEIDDNLEDNSI